MTQRPLRTTLAGLSLVLLAGCNDDPDAQAITKAARVSTNAVSAPEQAQQSYNEMLTTLNAMTASASAGTVDAANAMRGLAQTGLASAKAAEAQAHEFELREKAIVVRATVSKWQRLNAQAEAAAQISTADELAEIDALMTERQADREEYLAAKADYDARVSELEEQIADYEAQALEQRNAAGELQLQLSGVDPTEAPALAERIREYTLRGDELDRKASELGTARDQIAPESREA